METEISTAEIKQPSGQHAVASKKSVLWKWPIVATLVLVTILFWRFGAGLMEGRRLSANGMQRFHALLNSGQYEQIYEGASDAFRRGGRKEDLIKFFQLIHRKLGDAGSSSLHRVNVTATPTGTYITAAYTTTFTEGEADEAFVWLKSGQGVVLNGYNIRSMKLSSE
jgi:hypothetical protein